MVATRLGGMTVAELDERISSPELSMWSALFSVEAEERRAQQRKR